ncbi:translation initiation factor IF-2 [Helicobacter cholecystus]|uniref:Translation initiation factor IF-2 n=1 Tax=Helicobacter cholecystus TaxID=45498 RepID=A0A3D8IZA6_9HELI|nr:translation initiation factor IF-2 [Helicobacter cholecystus]RDU69954.1 translation initiation factor IF-2 [Helicobacter cholecystus]VEJ24880.1 translation initiation factor IF-2 [Helicobacter cholecystus]
MSITIKDFAVELAMSNPKDALQKAKELGISVKNVGSEISDEDAQKLADYIMSGKLPQKKASSKSKNAKMEKLNKENKPTKAKSEKIQEDPKKEIVQEAIKEATTDLEEKNNLENKRVGITIVKKSKDASMKTPIKEETKKQVISPNIKDLFNEIKDIKEEEELKVKPKKKEKPKVQVSHKQNEQKMNFDREFGSFEDESDEIVLFDLHEQEIKNEDEENRKKQAIVDRVQMQKKNKWMNEGSIRRDKKKRKTSPAIVEKKSVQSAIVIPEEIRVYEFADVAGRELKDVIGALFKLGVMVTKNDFLDRDAIEILAEEFSIEISFQNIAPEIEIEEEQNLETYERPPVVTIMGHVDHGKTSLLDKIRNSRVASGEAGGITQHIGAYMVEKNTKMISFIDTPGHEAFTEMRSRGAQVTDIAIIVIAADDGVKQQTIEALNHAKAANVQIIIAMNKMDKENANPDKVKAECAELGFTPSEWGGEYDFIPLSARSGEGIEDLLENILVQAELLELKATHSNRAKAIVLEGSLEKGRGPVATIIVQNGVLRVGDPIVADTAFGRVRALLNDRGENIKELYPSGVAVVTGLSEVPSAGATLMNVENDSIAREFAMQKASYLRQKELSKSTKVSFDELSEMVAKGQLKSLPVIVKADTQGSLEAIRASLKKLNNDEVAINVISFGVGGISESDISLASASENCLILGFNVRPTGSVKNKAKELAVEIKTYSIIYALLDDVKALISGMMSPVFEEENTGQAEVRETFNIPKVGTIAGCFVVDGSIQRGIKVRLIRNGVVVHNGSIVSLKRFKDDVKEVAKGYECGIMLENYNDVRVGDVFETYKEVVKKQTL